MYEETKSSIDWKGIFLKVIIAFLIILIAVKGYTTLKGNNDKKVETITNATAESKSSSTFTANIEKLRDAGEKYYSSNQDKLPKTEGNTTMVTLNELIKEGAIESLADEDGKTCDGESSYVTAVLEGKKTKIKANLVCGNASSYSLVYMDANGEEKEETTNTTTSSNNNTTTTTTNKTTSSNKTTTCSNACGTTCGSTCTPSVSVNTNTSVSQNVTVNTTPKTTTAAKYYTVTFDSNGGSREYASQEVKANGTAFNPGTTSKVGYTFKEWQLNGKKYDFSTPVTKDITLVAKFTKNSYLDDEDEEYEGVLVTDTYTSYVYTMGWYEDGTEEFSITHTLKLPEELEDMDIEKAKISDIKFYEAITTQTLAKEYRNNHRDTFFYKKTGWESTKTTKSSLATIKSKDVDFDYSTKYKSLDDALDEGFEVIWETDNVYRQCSTPYSFTTSDGTLVENVCNYGIIYEVEWTYKYYR